MTSQPMEPSKYNHVWRSPLATGWLHKLNSTELPIFRSGISRRPHRDREQQRLLKKCASFHANTETMTQGTLRTEIYFQCHPFYGWWLQTCWIPVGYRLLQTCWYLLELFSQWDCSHVHHCRAHGNFACLESFGRMRRRIVRAHVSWSLYNSS